MSLSFSIITLLNIKKPLDISTSTVHNAGRLVCSGMRGRTYLQAATCAWWGGPCAARSGWYAARSLAASVSPSAGSARMLKERGVSVSTGQGSKAHNTRAHSTTLARACLAFHINVSNIYSCSVLPVLIHCLEDICTIFILMYLDFPFSFLEFKRKYSQLSIFWE